MSKPAKATWDTLAIVGPGLIGASIGLAALGRGVARRVVGIGRSEASLKTALQRGAITEMSLDLAAGVREANLIIAATPVDYISAVIAAAGGECKPGALLSDAGSVKGDIVKAVDKFQERPKPWRKDVNFVGGHPIAGSDKRGAEHASADLFVGRVTVLTPTTDSRREDVERLGDFWRALGANVIEMSPDEHDAALAFTSHLPHLIAAAIAGSTPERYVTLTAGGWLDTTRIAASDPNLWRQIFLANRGHVLAALASFELRLGQLSEALQSDDAATLDRLLAESKRIRDAVAS